MQLLQRALQSTRENQHLHSPWATTRTVGAKNAKHTLFDKSVDKRASQHQVSIYKKVQSKHLYDEFLTSECLSQEKRDFTHPIGSPSCTLQTVQGSKAIWIGSKTQSFPSRELPSHWRLQDSRKIQQSFEDSCHKHSSYTCRDQKVSNHRNR